MVKKYKDILTDNLTMHLGEQAYTACHRFGPEKVN
jgi:hypothetical protein